MTGYVPIADHPRSEEEYCELGSRLFDTGIPLLRIDGALEDCWLYKYLFHRKKRFTHSIADNPRKNSVAYHCVQAQKSEWLAEAANQFLPGREPDVLVWIDFGIFSIPGVTEKILWEFMYRAQNERVISIPGCWSRNYKYDDEWPCWRFCGGVWVVPFEYAEILDVVMKDEYKRHLKETDNLSWEVNTLARVEQRHPGIPIWHYKANHDASMFVNYRRTEYADGKQAQAEATLQ